MATRAAAARQPAADLPDVNVWLALAVAEHPHHALAQAYWSGSAAPRVWFCRITMLGLVRLLTQARVMGEGALDAAAALAVYDRFAALPEAGLHAEPLGCDAAMRRLVSPPTLPSRLLTDAYLAAFAQAAGLRLVSFDRDFERFAGLNLLRLDLAAQR